MDLTSLFGEDGSFLPNIGEKPEGSLRKRPGRTTSMNLEVPDNVIVGTPFDDDLVGTDGNTIVYGSNGDDSVGGTDGAGSNGVGEIDILIGGGGEDLFILGDESNPFYSTDGVETPVDLAVIVDFEAGVDQIQLYRDDTISYQFLSDSTTGISSTAIINNDRDLVGLVLDATASEVREGVLYTGDA